MERKIVTTHVYPPIPIRQFDWMAYHEGDEEFGARAKCPLNPKQEPRP